MMLYLVSHRKHCLLPLWRPICESCVEEKLQFVVKVVQKTVAPGDIHGCHCALH